MRKKGFTLIEMLTVIAIITLLIGILVPALSAARIRARKVAVKAQINSMIVGNELFTRDGKEDYPASNAFTFDRDFVPPPDPAWKVDGLGTPSGVMQGSHLLADALIGRDSLGYDPFAKGFGTTDPNYERWDPINDRLSPFIPTDGISLTSVDEPAKDAGGVIPGLENDNNLRDSDGTLIRAFVDKFGWPLLYYRADTAGGRFKPIITTDVSFTRGNGVYDGRDNEDFTSYAGVNPHRIADANQPLPDPVITNIAACIGGETLEDRSRFAEFIRSFRATTNEPNSNEICRPRPVRSDSFIILSAGHDGIYGNLDDVANFEVLSKER